jgi:hypothetical protein
MVAKSSLPLNKLSFFGARLGRRELAFGFCDAEVRYAQKAVVADDQVVRRNVAVHDAEQVIVIAAQLVRGMQPVARGDDQMHCELDRKRALLCAQLPEQQAQGLAADLVHRDEVAAFVFADLVHLHDVRVMNARGDARFVEEHRHERFLTAEVFVDQLDRDQPLESTGPLGATEIQIGHAAFTELGEDAVASDPRRKQSRASERFA